MFSNLDSVPVEPVLNQLTVAAESAVRSMGNTVPEITFIYNSLILFYAFQLTPIYKRSGIFMKDNFLFPNIKFLSKLALPFTMIQMYKFSSKNLFCQLLFKKLQLEKADYGSLMI